MDMKKAIYNIVKLYAVCTRLCYRTLSVTKECAYSPASDTARN